MKFAALVGVACVALAAACSPAPASEIAKAQMLPPDQACLLLASEPFESVNGKRGKRVDRINSTMALKACEAATNANPNSGRLLAAYGRAILADAKKKEGPSADTQYDLALNTMQRAADVGDTYTAALLVANNNYVGRFDANRMIADAEPLLARARAQPSGDVRHAMAILLLEAAIHNARYRNIDDIPNFEESARAWDAYVPNAERSLEARVLEVGKRVGWVEFNAFIWELRRSGDFCDWQGRACLILGNGFQYAKDPIAALAASVDGIAEAYRSHDIAMSKLSSSSQDEIETLMFPGQSLADGARRNARRAGEWGGEAEKLAAADLNKAIDAFFVYRNRSVEAARQRVQSEETARWVAVGTLVVGALYLIGEAQSNSPAASSSWADTQRQIDCDTAQGIVMEDALNNRFSHPVWASMAAGC